MKFVRVSLFLFTMHTFGCQSRLANSDTEVKNQRQAASGQAVTPNLKKSYHLDRSILENKTEKTTVSSYLAMGVNYDSVEALFSNLKNDAGVSLKNRGEAHITVLTPAAFGGLA